MIPSWCSRTLGWRSPESMNRLRFSSTLERIQNPNGVGSPRYCVMSLVTQTVLG